MLKRFRRIKQKIAPYLVSSAVILVTIPIAIYTLLTTDSFDTRNKAAETPTYCTITFPYVNPRTLAVDKRYQINVHAEIENDEITSVNIMDQQAKRLFTKQYSPSVKDLSETFVYSPRTRGEEQLYGTVKTSTSSYPCKMLLGQEKLFIGIDNTQPMIITNPYKDASPFTNSLPIGDKYEYTLKASDKDLDNLDYSYSFTPRADWMKMSVIKNGQNGELELKFAGIPDQIASYLVTVFIHDGYNKHLVYQSWVISTAKDKTEIPPVKEPEEDPEIPKPDPGTDDNVKLNDPQITKLNPGEQTTIQNQRSTISANLTASKNAKIIKTSIIFKLDDADILTRSNVIEFSDSEYTISYTPESNLQNGEHKVFVYFKDSNNKEIQKEWTFTVEGDNSNAGTILGLPTKTFTIIAVGIFMLLLALTVPWILYSAWKKNSKDEYEEYPMPKPYNEGPALVPTAQPKHDILGQPIVEPIRKTITFEPPVQNTSEIITTIAPINVPETKQPEPIQVEMEPIVEAPIQTEPIIETAPVQKEVETPVNIQEPKQTEPIVEIPPIQQEVDTMPIQIETPATTLEPIQTEPIVEIPPIQTEVEPITPIQEVTPTTTTEPIIETPPIQQEVEPAIKSPYVPENLPETQVYIEPELATTPVEETKPPVEQAQIQKPEEVLVPTTPADIPFPVEESASLDELSTGLEDLAEALKSSSFSFLEEDKTKTPPDNKPN